jgi:hypothetical protein
VLYLLLIINAMIMAITTIITITAIVDSEMDGVCVAVVLGLDVCVIGVDAGGVVGVVTIEVVVELGVVGLVVGVNVVVIGVGNAVVGLGDVVALGVVAVIGAVMGVVGGAMV